MHFQSTQRQSSSKGYNTFEYTTVCSIFDKGYGFGFNSQEKDNDIAYGHFTAEFWEYDSRLGRRWNQDPEPVEWESLYAANRNNPIWYDDPDGNFPFRKSYEAGDVIKIRRWFKVIATITVVTFEEVCVDNVANIGQRGLSIVLEYKDMQSGLTSFNWIQTAKTNYPLDGKPKNEKFVDATKTSTPFYYSPAELILAENKFKDRPRRITKNGKTKWKGELSLVGKNAQGNYESLKTVKYGFKVKRDGTIKLKKIKIKSPSKFQNKTVKSAS